MAMLLRYHKEYAKVHGYFHPELEAETSKVVEQPAVSEEPESSEEPKVAKKKV